MILTAGAIGDEDRVYEFTPRRLETSLLSLNTTRMLVTPSFTVQRVPVSTSTLGPSKAIQLDRPDQGMIKASVAPPAPIVGSASASRLTLRMKSVAFDAALLVRTMNPASHSIRFSRPVKQVDCLSRIALIGMPSSLANRPYAMRSLEPPELLHPNRSALSSPRPW